MERVPNAKSTSSHSHKGRTVAGSKKPGRLVNERGKSGPPVSKPPGHKK